MPTPDQETDAWLDEHDPPEGRKNLKYPYYGEIRDYIARFREVPTITETIDASMRYAGNSRRSKDGSRSHLPSEFVPPNARPSMQEPMLKALRAIKEYRAELRKNAEH